MSSYKPYIIVSPPFEITSGGVRVLYGLYGHLLAKGQVAYLNERPLSGKFIAVYPEIEHGNPAGASTVMRYILNKPGVIDALYKDGTVMKGPTEFDLTDRLYYFSRLYGKAQDENHYLFLPVMNTHLFRDQKKIRRKAGLFLGKGINYPDIESKFIHPPNVILFNREMAQDQSNLANALNECQVLYCYDPVTAMTEIARLCGTRVVMVNPVYTKEEFEKYEPGMNGISWGRDEGVKLDTEAFREHYLGMVDEFSRKLGIFIEETQK